MTAPENGTGGCTGVAFPALIAAACFLAGLAVGLAAMSADRFDWAGVAPLVAAALGVALGLSLDTSGLASEDWHALRHERRFREMIVGRNLWVRSVRLAAAAAGGLLVGVGGAPAHTAMFVLMYACVASMFAFMTTNGCSMSPGPKTDCRACGPKPVLRWVPTDRTGDYFHQVSVWNDGTVVPLDDPAVLPYDARLVRRAEDERRARLAGVLASLPVADPMRVRDDVEVLARFGPRSRLATPGAAEAMEEATAHVVSVLSSEGWQVEERAFRMRAAVTYRDVWPLWRLKLWPYTVRAPLEGSNVLAVLPGRGSSTDAPLVLMAHLDTVARSPGADDNGSGVAVCLEAARLLSAARPERPVAVALVDMEEVNLIGSKALFRQIARTVERPVGVINMDSVGMWDPTPGAQRDVPRGGGMRLWARRQIRWLDAAGWHGDFTFLGWRRHSRWLKDEVVAAIDAVMGDGHVLLVRDPRPRGPVGYLMKLAVPALLTFDRSDHKQAWNRKIPAVVMNNAARYRVDNRYHQPEDLPDGLDYDRLAQLARAVAAVASSRTGGTDPGR